MDDRLRVTCWKWGRVFEARHVNVLRAMLARHLQLEHELVCITDDPTGLDGDIRVVPMPTDYAHTPRCRRRMQMFDLEFGAQLGRRILAIDLDVVIVGDLTAIVRRPEPIVGWRVRHANVYSGSFLLFDAGALHGAWAKFRDDPEGYPRRIQARGVASDQAMVNAWLAGKSIGRWTERDGFVTYFGAGYERLEYQGVGPTRRTLPKGARIVVLGSADKAVLDDAGFDWVREHWRAA